MRRSPMRKIGEGEPLERLCDRIHQPQLGDLILPRYLWAARLSPQMETMYADHRLQRVPILLLRLGAFEHRFEHRVCEGAVDRSVANEQSIVEGRVNRVDECLCVQIDA